MENLYHPLWRQRVQSDKVIFMENITVNISLKKIKIILTVIVLLALVGISVNFFGSNYGSKENLKNTSQVNSQPYKHPTLADCQNITNRIKKAFCIADVAEIQKKPQVMRHDNFRHPNSNLLQGSDWRKQITL